MSVLARELDSYQRALRAYQQQAGRHNSRVDAYNETLVRDADGNTLVLDPAGNLYRADAEGKLSGGQLPSGTLADYGATEIPDGGGYRLLRQKPTESKREYRDDVRYIPGFNEDGQQREGYYYTIGPERGDSGGEIQKLGAEWKVEERIPGRQMGMDNVEPDRFRVNRDASAYMERPEAWDKEFTMKAPTATRAQMQRAASPSMAEAEAGLIGQVLKGRGVR